jgi:hypothetical protein
MFALKPRHDPFFDMFDKAAQNVNEGAKALLDMLENWEDVPGKVRRLKNYEHAGDEYTHRILEKLAKTFITPLDREDIQRIGTRLDDVLDAMDAAANRMMLYDVGKPTEDAKGFARVLVKATALLMEGFSLLRDLKKPEMLLSTCVEIHTQENEGDRLLHTALANLFRDNQDPRTIIKWKDIYEILERATDHCEDVADVLQTIVLKNA